YALVEWKGRSAGAAFRLAAGLALGAALSCFAWLPSLVEKKEVYIDSPLGILAFDFHEHFVYWWQWFSPLWGYHGSFPGPADDMSFQIGPVHTVAILAGVLLFWRLGPGLRRRWALWSLGVALVSLALMLESSRPLWDLVGPMRYIQFPWRFLAM